MAEPRPMPSYPDKDARGRVLGLEGWSGETSIGDLIEWKVKNNQ